MFVQVLRLLWLDIVACTSYVMGVCLFFAPLSLISPPSSRCVWSSDVGSLGNQGTSSNSLCPWPREDFRRRGRRLKGTTMALTARARGRN
ncbi:hypothetical protein LZ32DRAFT_133555 [Colletotrichum eremochloae]|nr:hypothetical protein LZ32DRAFT_133555 [Colletotrichum eremochloae]